MLWGHRVFKPTLIKISCMFKLHDVDNDKSFASHIEDAEGVGSWLSQLLESQETEAMELSKAFEIFNLSSMSISSDLGDTDDEEQILNAFDCSIISVSCTSADNLVLEHSVVHICGF